MSVSQTALRPWEIEFTGRLSYVDRSNPNDIHIFPIEEKLASKDTPFQKIDIYKTKMFGKLLVLDGDPQSSEFDQDIYHDALVNPALQIRPSSKNVLILGGGEGVTLQAALRNRSVEKAIMVDIDGDVVELCGKFFPEYWKGVISDKRGQIIIGDALKFLKETDERFDCILSDLTEPNPDAEEAGFLTPEFFRLIKSRLKPDGVFGMQASDAARGKDRLHRRYIETAKSLWKNVKPYKAFIPCFYTEWGFLTAHD